MRGTARQRTRRPSCFHVPRQNTEAQLKSTPRPALSRLLDSQESARGRRGPETTTRPPTAQVLRASGWLGDSGLKPGNHLRGLGYTARPAGQDARPQASLRSRETQGQGLAPRAWGPATWTGRAVTQTSTCSEVTRGWPSGTPLNPPQDSRGVRPRRTHLRGDAPGRRRRHSCLEVTLPGGGDAPLWR